MIEIDLAVVQDDAGKMSVHRAQCPDARAAADRGLPVMTMFGCTGLPPTSTGTAAWTMFHMERVAAKPLTMTEHAVNARCAAR